MYKQEPPMCVQIELTEGCNLYCEFCGLRGIRKNPGENLRFMRKRVASTVAQKLSNAGWTSRIEFAMHGEPTLNPECEEIVTIFRNALPKSNLMMTTNGGGLLSHTKDKIYRLFAAGLNTLAIDEYEYVKIGEKIRKALELPKSRRRALMQVHDGIHYYNYPEALDLGNPHRRISNVRRVCMVRDISVAKDGTHATLNNHCGAGAPLDYSAQGAKCAKPFRELSVRWNGNVAICCNDWRGIYKCGNLVVHPLDAIWNGERMNAARRYLYHGKRVFKPCLGCNAKSYRVGLLPDKKGKEKVPQPSLKTVVTVKEAIAGKPYTPTVQRDWEKGVKS